jgi:ABC-type bacteriocin/lantibiotic exporter with double-glycine peptidase domain
MRRGLTLFGLIVLPVFLFAVKPSNQNNLAQKDDLKVSELVKEKSSDHSASFTKRKAKRLKKRFKKFQSKLESINDSSFNFLFSSVFLFFSGLILSLAFSGASALFAIIGLVAMLLAAIFATIAFKRKTDKRFLVNAWFFIMAIPVFILAGIIVVGALFGILF